MNNLLLNTAAVTESATRRFSDTLMLFRNNEIAPFAMRAPLDTEIPPAEGIDAKIIYESEDFRISKQDNNIYCSINRKDSPHAVISLFDDDNATNAVKAIRSYFSTISSIDLTRISVQNAFRELGRLIDGVADYCGCLTDINDPDISEHITGSRSTHGTPYLAAALPEVCLMYRRLAALRGFNFKLIFPEKLPCLAFSARILGKGISALPDIPEYSALSELDRCGGITVYARLTDLPDDGGEQISKLTVLLTPQAADPRGILKAPDWKQKTKDRLEMLDIDIPGRF